jgi:signal transduction histidine kinase/phage shock protein PspC (stress-responsive transcriptional regulator)
MTGMSKPAEQATGTRPLPGPVHEPVPGQVPGPARLCRHRSDRVLAGVSSGIAEHLGVPVLWVRMIFVALAGVGGAGLIGYALLWAFLPATDVRPRRPGTARDRQQAVGLVVLGAGLALVGAALGTPWAGWLTGPLGVALIGAGVVWREADASQRTRWRSGAGAVSGVFLGGRMALLRVLAGIALVTSGIGVFLINQGNLGQARFALLAAAATLVGVAVLTVPWWLRLMHALGEERRARIRTEERAEIAAHLHDSVLQTLALIQQQSDSGREVRRLARSQERELRAWLYGPQGYGRPKTNGAVSAPAFAAALHAAAGEVEDTYAVSMQVVVVGDCVLDDPLPALVQASREAMVNAAKHAGVTEVSVYAEVEPGQVHVFVRDRGCGFDPATVAADRHGLADSIHGRMQRHGGSVTLRTAPGEGTEVQLAIARCKGGEET